MDKTRLIAAWKAHLESGVQRATAGQLEARKSMRVDGDNRPANRGERAAVTSQGYLAQGLANRLDELNDALALLERVGTGRRHQVVMGALVRVGHEEGAEFAFILLPGGDATVLSEAGREVIVLSPDAPFVRFFSGLEVSDEVEVSLPNKRGHWEVLSVE